MNVAVRPATASPRFSGVDIKFNYAPSHEGDSRFVESVSFEVVPDSVFKGVRSNPSTTNLDEAPSAAADSLTRSGTNPKKPLSTDTTILANYRPAALNKLLDMLVDDAPFWPPNMRILAKIILAHGLPKQDGRATYLVDTQTRPVKDPTTGKTEMKDVEVATFTVANPHITYSGGTFFSQLPNESELDKLGIVKFVSDARGRQLVKIVAPPAAPLKQTIIATPADDDGGDTVELPPTKK